MAIPKTPSQKNQYSKLNKRLATYVSLVHSLYERLNEKAVKIALESGYDGEGEFKFNDDTITKKLIADVQKEFVSEMDAIIYTGTSKEWRESNKIQDLLANKVLSFYEVTNAKGEKYKKYYQTNSDALKAFQDRRSRGMNLSRNLWKQATDYKTALEETISTAIQRGTSAVTLSKKVSQYLLDFDKMRDDYTGKFGKKSKAKDCEYRSIRLARSEINMAYRTAEQTRWRQFDFILGYEIKTSKAHKVKDVCDDLCGKYPKDFKWTGWHPNDMCYAVPIIMSDEEFWGFDEDGNEVETTPRYVEDVPPVFKHWVRENRDKIAYAEKRGTLPYFLRDNKEVYQGVLNTPNAIFFSKAKRTRKVLAEQLLSDLEAYRMKEVVLTPKHVRLAEEAETAIQIAKKNPSEANLKAANEAFEAYKSDCSYKFLQINYLEDSSVEALLSEYYRQYEDELPHGVIQVVMEKSSSKGYYMATYSDQGIFIFYGGSDFDVRSAMMAIKQESKFFKYGVREERALQSLYHEIRHNTVGSYDFAEVNPCRYVCETVHELVSLYDYPRFIENIGGKAMFQSELLATPGYANFVNGLRTKFIKRYKINESKLVQTLKEYEDKDPRVSVAQITEAILEQRPHLDREDIYIKLKDFFEEETKAYVAAHNL